MNFSVSNSGVSLAEKNAGDTPGHIDHILIHRAPILDYWRQTDEPLVHVVRHVLIHVPGHHFGLSNAEMKRTGR